ncbi:TetR/AcrR family transcriptional regulator [Roseospira navarrensis]|nr:TetR/AcrR family transcriptional regulator [Roseospira navarrensis]
MAENDTTSTGDVSRRLIDAALGLAAEDGWRRLTMAAIAERAGVPLNAALRVHGSRNEVLRAMGHHVDAAMLDEALTFTDQDGPRDRLFDMLMRRFDALSPWRAGLAAIIKDLPADPGTFVVSMQGVYHSMGLALEAASLPADGFGGLATRKGLAAVYLSTMRVWTEDDTEDLSRTMAALDKNLDRAESVVGTLCRVIPCRGKGRGKGKGKAAPTPSPDADPAWTPEDAPGPDDRPSSGHAPA